ncbi:hypothetical protein [Chitinophaga dinghuensis]|nr:hypothetical protein [Chitinophaga dinghuensis]
MRNRLILVALFFLCGSQQKSFAQEFKDTTGFREAYRKMQIDPNVKPYSYDVTVVGNIGQTPDTMKATISFGPERMKMKMGEMEVILNPQYRIMINNTFQQMIVSRNYERTVLAQMSMPSIEAIIPFIDTWSLAIDKGVKKLTFNCQPGTGFKSFVVTSDIKTGYMLQVFAVGADVIDEGISTPPTATSYFSNYRIIKADFEEFKSETYLVLDGPDLKPAGKYKDYSLTFDKPNQ